DSPSFFGRLLDDGRGGVFRVLADGGELTGKMQYVRNTNVVRTLFSSGGCQWELFDFAPRIPEGLGVRVPVQVVRLLRPLQGEPRLSIDFDPRPDYARAEVHLEEAAGGLEVRWPGGEVHLETNLPLSYLGNRQPFVLNEPLYFVLSWGKPEAPASLANVLRDLEITIAGWRAWAKTCSLPNFAAAEVLRSALCLKLHTYHDTGAIIAAATTSIPEALGTERTWDYRHCWLRDAAFVVEALRRLSHLSEGEQFIRFLRNVAESGPLQPVYGIDGNRTLPEEILGHLAGFKGCGPVRIGNAAAEQRQNDLMGEMLLCLETLLYDHRLPDPDMESFFPLIERLVEEAIRAAPLLDTGIWEFRSYPRAYTFSRAMCWVAVHRGAAIARRYGREDLAARWDAIAANEQRIVLERGYNPSLGFFTQALDGQFPDASNLLLPTLGILDAKDPRFLSTLSAYEKLLATNGLMLRYKNPDDFGETTSAFTICSFWWAEALALAGRLDDAVVLFNRLLEYANPVGLFSEDVDPATGMLLGNFPQAYTHVGLIHAAMTIEHFLEARDGRVRAWT
ncbi:MAG: glycoside hydrolase family 15 protein, partial [Bdellovibrionota bacterium]